jgi:hypothetical protein
MRKTLAVLGGLGLAAVFAQFPEYAQQYEQRLGGAVDELRIIVADFDADALRFGLSREDALHHYAVSPDAFLVARGESMARTLARYGRLNAQLIDLAGADAWTRVTHLNDYLDAQISSQALAAFKPAVPVTGEGVMWGIAGFALAYGLLAAFLSFLTLPFRWRNGREPHRRVPLWHKPVPRQLAIETVTLDDVVEARRKAQRHVDPDRPVAPLEPTAAEPAVPAEQRFG